VENFTKEGVLVRFTSQASGILKTTSNPLVTGSTTITVELRFWMLSTSWQDIGSRWKDLGSWCII